MPDTVKYKGKTYKVNGFNNLSRKQVRTLRGAIEQVNAGSSNDATTMQQLDASEALWDMVSIVLPSIPERVLDDMGMDDAQDLLSRAGIIQDTTDSGDDEGVSLGESAASTVS